MSEATLVAPAEEAKVPQPEDEAPPSPPAPEAPVEQQAEEPAEVSLEAALEDLLRPSTDAEEAASTGTESDDEVKLTPEEQAKFDRLEAKKAKREQELNQETQDINDLRDLTERARNTALQAGFSPEWANFIAQRALDGRNLGLKVGRIEGKDAGSYETVQTFYKVMAEQLPANKRQAFLNAHGTEHTTHEDTIKGWMDAVVDERVRREVKKAKDEAKQELRALLIEKKLLKGHDAPPAEGSSGASSSSDEAKLADPNTPVSELIAIRERQKRAGG